MRSRYVAHTLNDQDYLMQTLAPESRDDEDVPEEGQTSDLKWQGLEIRATDKGAAGDKTGAVEYVAKYKSGDQTGIHHERSTFRQEEGRWYCVGGEINPKPEQRKVEKVGRNEPCPCGSGKKFKKCCGG